MITLKRVDKTYASTYRTILKNVNLHIAQGDFVIIVGSSGSGKSTLLKIIGCLDLDFEGEMIFENQKVENENISSQIRKLKIGYIFQDFKLLNDYTIYQNLEIVLGLSNCSKNKDEIIKETLGKVNLSLSILSCFPYQLSGGQKQRVAIARALLKNPKVIVGDEITGSLDVKNGRQIMEILKELNAQGITIILATHDEKYLRIGNRIFIVEGNNVHESG